MTYCEAEKAVEAIMGELASISWCSEVASWDFGKPTIKIVFAWDRLPANEIEFKEKLISIITGTVADYETIPEEIVAAKHKEMLKALSGISEELLQRGALHTHVMGNKEVVDMIRANHPELQDDPDKPEFPV